MTRREASVVALIVMFVVGFSVAAVSGSVATQQRSANSNQVRTKKLREIAMERDVEVEGVSYSEYENLEDISKEAPAIVYGRILGSRSFFDESGDPVLEYGELITTEYTVDVLRVLKDKTLDNLPSPERAQPVPLQSPLKIARNGGVVQVKSHRAAVKVKGFEALEPEKQYVFFLSWSPGYKAYVLAGGLSGAIRVNDDLSLTPLGSSKEMQSQLRAMDLESFLKQIN